MATDSSCDYADEADAGDDTLRLASRIVRGHTQARQAGNGLRKSWRASVNGRLKRLRRMPFHDQPH